MSTRDRQPLRFVALLACSTLCAAAPAAAQDVCDPLAADDAGSPQCEDDAGIVQPDPPDAGIADAGAMADGGTAAQDAGSGGRPDAGGVSGSVCSCESDLDEDGHIHVCTESDSAAVCREFDCDLGLRRGRPCPSAPTRLCCEMRSRELQSYLYEDCTHPNCESGFREQCRAFGGRTYTGACETPAAGGPGPYTGEDDDAGSICSAGAPGGRSASPATWLVAVLGAALAALTRRRRSAPPA